MLVESGSRFHQQYLRNMHGCLLTLLDSQGRILMFVGGALRCRTSDTADTVYTLSPARLLQGWLGADTNGVGYQSDVREISLTGDERRGEWECKLRDIPRLSYMLGGLIPEATSWGVMNVWPSPGKKTIDGALNCINGEQYLCPHSWKPLSKAGPVAGSGGNSLVDRLAPQALEYAEAFPSAWLLAITATSLFGGMGASPIPPVNVAKSAALTGLVAAEMSLRAQKAAERELRRFQQQAQSRSVPAIVNLGSLLEAMDQTGAPAPAPRIIHTDPEDYEARLRSEESQLQTQAVPS